MTRPLPFFLLIQKKRYRAIVVRLDLATKERRIGKQTKLLVASQIRDYSSSAPVLKNEEVARAAVLPKLVKTSQPGFLSMKFSK